MKLVSALYEGLRWQQERHVREFALKREHIMFHDPRTGKTKGACRGFIRAVLEESIYRVLIAGPKTVCETVWEPEVREAIGFLPPDCPVTIIDCHSGKLDARRVRLRSAVLARRERLTTAEMPHVEIVIINRDSLMPLIELLLEWQPQYLILDELHNYKNAGSLRSRAAFRLGRVSRYRLGLTGTPVSRHYGDLYGEYKIISPATFGTNKRAFDNRYCVFPSSKWASRPISYQNVEELRQKAFAIASVVPQSACFDMPEVQDVTRELTLPPEVRRIYDTIVKEHILELKSGREIAMTHTLARMTQLRQIAIGYTRFNEQDERTTEWIHNEKIDCVLDELEDLIDAGEKVAVFHAFSPEGNLLASRVKKLCQPIVLNGSVTKKGARAEAISLFRDSKEHPLIIIQEQTASEGISLAAANYIIFLSCGMAADIHTQAQDRIFKPNTTGNVKLTRIYPKVKNTIEGSVLKMLRDKMRAEDFLLSGPRADTFESMALGNLG